MTTHLTKNETADFSNNEITATPSLEIDPQAQRITLLVPLDQSVAINANTLEALTNMGFTTKEEFHVTAVDIKTGSAAASVFKGLADVDQRALIDILKSSQNSLWHINPRDEFYLVEKRYEHETRRSIVQIVDCPELKGLYADLNIITGKGAELAIPPPHITLATQGSPRGIGISTTTELVTLGTRITIP